MKKRLLGLLALMMFIFTSIASATIFQVQNESGTAKLVLDMVTGEFTLTGDSIAEASIDMDTSCAAGNHLYVSGNNFACEADDDTTYTNLNEFANTNGFFDNLVNFTGTLTNTRLCRYDSGGTEIDCDVEDLSAAWNLASTTTLNGTFQYNIGANCSASNFVLGVNTAGGLDCAVPTDTTYSALSEFTNDVGYIDDLVNITGTLTNTYYCRYDSGSTEIDCDVNPATVGGGNSTEQMQDSVLAVITGEEGITYAYSDAGNSAAITFDCSEVTDFVGDNLTCSGENLVVTDSWVDAIGDTMTGDLNMSGTDGVIVSSHSGKILINATGVFITA